VAPALPGLVAAPARTHGGPGEAAGGDRVAALMVLAVVPAVAADGPVPAVILGSDPACDRPDRAVPAAGQGLDPAAAAGRADQGTGRDSCLGILTTSFSAAYPGGQNRGRQRDVTPPQD
jgi:hypothetical protein